MRPLRSLTTRRPDFVPSARRRNSERQVELPRRPLARRARRVPRARSFRSLRLGCTCPEGTPQQVGVREQEAEADGGSAGRPADVGVRPSGPASAPRSPVIAIHVAATRRPKRSAAPGRARRRGRRAGRGSPRLPRRERGTRTRASLEDARLLLDDVLRRPPPDGDRVDPRDDQRDEHDPRRPSRSRSGTRSRASMNSASFAEVEERRRGPAKAEEPTASTASTRPRGAAAAGARAAAPARRRANTAGITTSATKATSTIEIAVQRQPAAQRVYTASATQSAASAASAAGSIRRQLRPPRADRLERVPERRLRRRSSSAASMSGTTRASIVAVKRCSSSEPSASSGSESGNSSSFTNSTARRRPSRRAASAARCAAPARATRAPRSGLCRRT